VSVDANCAFHPFNENLVICTINSQCLTDIQNLTLNNLLVHINYLHGGKHIYFTAEK